ncbi:MAG TPA: vanadium-dependent haloperoxidase [Gemmatimonadales bacterium]|nr:vanadium-dependent haloperoxidase [Gemmatimonadales bacterium]
MRVRITVMALFAAVVVAIGGAATTRAHAQPASTPDTYVSYWDAVGSQAFTAAALTPPEGFVIFANVGIAAYDSVMAIEGGYQPFAVEFEAPEGASAEAAVVAAAHAILVHYLPQQRVTILDPAYVQSLATIPDGQAKADGITTGEQVASDLIAVRADDNFRLPVPYIPPDPPIPGVWIPTAQSPPIGTYMPYMRPFSLDSPDQFRPAGPPSLSSRDWASDYNEAKEIGSRTSTSRTAEQTLAARFWAEPPIQQAHAAFRRFLLDHGLDVADASRFMAMVTVASADAGIACFDAKYHYAFWRPITAIRAGDTDGNEDTVGDPNWLPLLAATPNHPEYPSAHSCVTTASARVIARFLDTQQIDFTVPSITGLGDRHFDTVKDLEYEVTNARIWGGIHFRTAVDDGTKIGMKTAHQVLAHHFHRAGE